MARPTTSNITPSATSPKDRPSQSGQSEYVDARVDANARAFLKAVARLGTEAKVSDLVLLSQMVGQPIAARPASGVRLGGSANTLYSNSSVSREDSLVSQVRLAFVAGDIENEKASMALRFRKGRECIGFDDIKAAIGEPTKVLVDPPRHANVKRRPDRIYSLRYVRSHGVVLSFVFRFEDCAIEFGFAKNVPEGMPR